MSDENEYHFSDHNWGLFPLATLYPAQTWHFNMNARCLSGDRKKRK